VLENLTDGEWRTEWANNLRINNLRTI